MAIPDGDTLHGGDSMNVQKILDRFNQVKAAGDGKWTACCPAHDDKTPSLSLKDAGDRLLLHCFAGCSVHDICTAIDIGVHDLFADEKKAHQIIPGVSRRQLADALETELLILAQCAHMRAAGTELAELDADREALAWQRVDAARRAQR
jgi:hypothetical protein